MKQGTLFYDRESGRYNFFYTDEDGDRRYFLCSISSIGMSTRDKEHP